MRRNETGEDQGVKTTAICYYSQHHGNTKKLLDAIRKSDPEVVLIDVTNGVMKDGPADLEEYDRIGFASGIYYSSFAKQLLAYLRDQLPEGKDVFFLYTAGAGRNDRFAREISEAAKEKKARILGTYGCSGYDTFGPFKLVGGLKKGHPDAKEIGEAVQFYRSLPGKA